MNLFRLNGSVKRLINEPPPIAAAGNWLGGKKSSSSLRVL